MEITQCITLFLSISFSVHPVFPRRSGIAVFIAGLLLSRYERLCLLRNPWHRHSFLNDSRAKVRDLAGLRIGWLIDLKQESALSIPARFLLIIAVAVHTDVDGLQSDSHFPASLKQLMLPQILAFDI